MLWQAPGSIRLKHLVLQHKIVGVGPIVRNFACIMVAHDVGRGRVGAGRVIGVGAASAGFLGLGLETVHLPAIDIGDGVSLPMRAATVAVIWVVIWPYTLVCLWIGHANGRNSILHGDTICSRICPEVGVERAVLLHNYNNMLNLMHATAAIVGLARIRAERVRTGGKRCCRQQARQNNRKKLLRAVKYAYVEYFHMLISLNCKFTVEFLT